MFSIFLFLVVFSFFSWLQFDPQHSSCQHQSNESAVLVPKINIVEKSTPPISKAHTKPGARTLANLTAPPVTVADLPILESLSEVPVLSSSILLSQGKTSLEVELRELLMGIDIDNLQLRPARKIAKALNIAQKINGRDQTLGFLRNQIKVKLQQLDALPVETVEVLRQVLAS